MPGLKGKFARLMMGELILKKSRKDKQLEEISQNLLV
jgi:hypothetical protein